MPVGRTLYLFTRHRRPFIALFGGVMIACSLVVAFLLRFDFAIPPSEWDHLQTAFWIALITKLIAFRVGGLQEGWSRFVGMRDVVQILVSNVLGSILFTVAVMGLIGRGFPRSVLGIDLLVCFLITATMRCSVRIYRELFVKRPTKGRKRIFIYGAGSAGAMLLREIRGNPSLGYIVAGFLDDDPNKWRTSVHAVPVIGAGREAPVITARFARKGAPIREIVIAMPSASGPQMQEALANCRAAGIPCKTIPGMAELLGGRVLASQIRDVSVIDLLGREAVELDETLIRESIVGQSVMVTGAAGSIGSEICRQVARFSPERLVLFEQAESDLFRLHNQLLAAHPNLKIVAQIGDIRDYKRIDEVIRQHGVESIFHAAAYKHVPLMENHVIEAVTNNILGTRNVVTAAQNNGVRNFLMISSDKAVNPTNVMGTTKRVAELIVSSVPFAENTGQTRCLSVRFGNVLGSNGSVVPTFKEQIASGGPVTVTHPEMRRYFMTIPEAVQLVLQASTMGNGSEIFVLDMGAPVKIVDLARNMIRLSGLEPDVDIEIRYTGLRPGEKLFEELATEGENILSTYHPKIKIFAGQKMNQNNIEAWIERLEMLISARLPGAIVEHLQEMVPEYTPFDGSKARPAALAMSATAGR